jgi:hypothetical protein
MGESTGGWPGVGEAEGTGVGVADGDGVGLAVGFGLAVGVDVPPTGGGTVEPLSPPPPPHAATHTAINNEIPARLTGAYRTWLEFIPHPEVFFEGRKHLALREFQTLAQQKLLTATVTRLLGCGSAATTLRMEGIARLGNR